MEYAPVISFIPVIIASCARMPNWKRVVVNLGHLPENKYAENPNLYWLGSPFSTRLEIHSHMSDATAWMKRKFGAFHFKISRKSHRLGFLQKKTLTMPDSILPSGISAMSSWERYFPEKWTDNFGTWKAGAGYQYSSRMTNIDPKIEAIADLVGVPVERDISTFRINTGHAVVPTSCFRKIHRRHAYGKACTRSFRTFLLLSTAISPWTILLRLLAAYRRTARSVLWRTVFVQAYQSPSVVEFVERYSRKTWQPAETWNTALDETAQITLPNGTDYPPPSGRLYRGDDERQEKTKTSTAP